MTTETAYRNCAIAGASPIGLMIALFDRLVVDLQRAAAAIRTGDIETRCRELNHAALIIGQLESWLDFEKGGETAENLSRFYRHLRAQMLEAAASKSPSLLEDQIALILHVRSAWQQLDARSTQNEWAQSGVPSADMNSSYLQAAEPAGERMRFSECV